MLAPGDSSRPLVLLCMYRHVLEVSPYLCDVYTLGAAILTAQCCIWWNAYGLRMVVPYAVAQTAQLPWIILLLVQIDSPTTCDYHSGKPFLDTLPLSCCQLW